MTETPFLSDLRAPPKVGRWYMVPTIRHAWHTHTDDWPVLGPLHTDDDFFKFPHAHYHVDHRFLTYQQAQIAIEAVYHTMSHLTRGERLAFACTAYPLSDAPEDKDWGLPARRLPRHRPTLRKVRCARLGAGTPIALVGGGLGLKAVNAMAKHYGNPAQPIKAKGGRLLCPHRKVDLSQFTPDADGVVICPLHGLRVQCGRPGLVLTP